jgi:hypothetical protein
VLDAPPLVVAQDLWRAGGVEVPDDDERLLLFLNRFQVFRDYAITVNLIGFTAVSQPH